MGIITLIPAPDLCQTVMEYWPDPPILPQGSCWTSYSLPARGIGELWARSLFGWDRRRNLPAARSDGSQSYEDSGNDGTGRRAGHPFVVDRGPTRKDADT